MLALAGHDDYTFAVIPVWTPEVELSALGVDERTAAATGEAVVRSIVLKGRIGDRIAETMGGFHWHGPIPTVVSVRTSDGALVRFRMEKGSVFAHYVEGDSRKANGDLLWEFQADAGIHAAVSTFEHEGQQYVVALAGA